MFVMMLLGQLTYRLLDIYRSATTRPGRKPPRTWRELMQDLRDALIRATLAHLEGLRRRTVATI
jgi:hypothetical protein